LTIEHCKAALGNVHRASSGYRELRSYEFDEISVIRKHADLAVAVVDVVEVAYRYFTTCESSPELLRKCFSSREATDGNRLHEWSGCDRIEQD